MFAPYPSTYTTGYDAVYIVEIQKEMHDKYKKKLHDVK